MTVGASNWSSVLRFTNGSYAEPSHVPVTETKQPSGPFDFSAINPQLISSPSPGQRGMSSKQRAHTVPLLSPTICRRNLGQLMPLQGNASIVPPVHEALRFSSLPCSLEPSANAMDVDNIAKLPDESERVGNSSVSRTSPSQKELDPSSLCKTPVVEDKSLPTIDQLPLAAPSPEVIPSNVSPSVPPPSSTVRPFSVLAELTFTLSSYLRWHSTYYSRDQTVISHSHPDPSSHL